MSNSTDNSSPANNSTGNPGAGTPGADNSRVYVGARNLAAVRHAQPATELRIAGLTKFSTVDWPGRVVATLFLQGCPWDCFYCHNPSLINPRTPGAVAFSEVEELLAKRKGLLDGVVFSGGEPTMQRGLLDAMRQVHEMGFAVGLHSCGAFPSLLAKVLPEVDWIGLDIKSSVPNYPIVTGRPQSGDKAWESLRHILKAVDERAESDRPLGYEVRTTVHTSVMSPEELGALATKLAREGVKHYTVQEFRAEGVRDELPVHSLRAGQHGAISRGALHLKAHDARKPLDVEYVPKDAFETFCVR